MFEIQLVKGAKPTGGALITAFPSVGMVGTIAGSYVSDSLKMDRLAYVISDEVPPAALVQEGVPMYPLRIMGSKRVSILTSEFQIPLVLSAKLGKQLLDWSLANGYEFILGLEGLMTGQEAEEQKDLKVFGVGTTPHARELLKSAGIEQFKVGMITGVSGALLSEGERLEKDIMCLLVQANPLFPDARGAARLVEAVIKLMPSLKVDVQELYKEAELIEQNVKEAVEKTKDVLAARQNQAERLGRSFMYG